MMQGDGNGDDNGNDNGDDKGVVTDDGRFGRGGIEVGDVFPGGGGVLTMVAMLTTEVATD